MGLAKTILLIRYTHKLLSRDDDYHKRCQAGSVYSKIAILHGGTKNLDGEWLVASANPFWERSENLGAAISTLTALK